MDALAASSPRQPAFNRSDDVDASRPLPPLPGIRMLDPIALTTLLSANTAPPEITSILLFNSNGAIFAHSCPSPLLTRHLRSLAATYGAAFTTYATVSNQGNLTGVNAGAHPSSYVTAVSEALLRSGPRPQGQWRTDETSTAATSVYDGVESTRSLGRHMGVRSGADDSGSGTTDTGSAIAFDDGDSTAVVTRVTGTILLAVIGPCSVNANASTTLAATAPPFGQARTGPTSAWSFTPLGEGQRKASVASEVGREGPKEEGTGLLDRLTAPARSGIFRRTPSGRTESCSGDDGAATPTAERHPPFQSSEDRELASDEPTAESVQQAEHVDREQEEQDDYDRLASLNLSASPEVLLALESKSAALGRFLRTRLRGLVCPDDF